MTPRQAILHVYKQPQDALYYWQGVLRWFVYKRPGLRWLLRWHIRQQFEWRKKRASDCYYAGECRCCGCTTPQLFMADKACSAGKKIYPRCQHLTPCYPKMMNRRAWYWYRVYAQH